MERLNGRGKFRYKSSGPCNILPKRNERLGPLSILFQIRGRQTPSHKIDGLNSTRVPDFQSTITDLKASPRICVVEPLGQAVSKGRGFRVVDAHAHPGGAASRAMGGGDGLLKGTKGREYCVRARRIQRCRVTRPPTQRQPQEPPVLTEESFYFHVCSGARCDRPDSRPGLPTTILPIVDTQPMIHRGYYSQPADEGEIPPGHNIEGINRRLLM